MSTDQQSSTVAARVDWRAGAIGGVAGAIVMAALVLAMNAPTLAVAIPSLYGLAPPQNPVLGLAVHVVHGAVLGLVFARIVRLVEADSSVSVLAAAAAWGVGTWLVLAAVLMPLWLEVVGSPASPPFPNFAIPSLFWHLVYGVVLGAVFLGVQRLRTRDEPAVAV